MTESTEPHPEKEKHWLGTLLKVVFFTGAALLLVFTVMANMGGSNDTLKGAVEQFLTDASGYQSTVTKLNRMNFFPTIGLNMEGIEMHRADGDYDTAVTIGKVDIAMGFWDVTFNTGKIKKLTVENASVLPGVILSHPMHVEKISIEEDQGDLAFFEGRGVIGPHNFSFQADMEASGISGARKYRFSDNHPFVLAADDINLEGRLLRGGNTIEINELILAAPQKILGGSLSFSVADERKLHITGSLEIDGGSNAELDLTTYRDETRRHLNGTIKCPVLQGADLMPGGKLPALYDKIETILGWPVKEDGTADLSAIDLDIAIEAADFIENGQSKGALSTKVTVKDGKIDWGSLAAVVKPK
jgi:hypothetical protein